MDGVRVLHEAAAYVRAKRSHDAALSALEATQAILRTQEKIVHETMMDLNRADADLHEAALA